MSNMSREEAIKEGEKFKGDLEYELNDENIELIDSLLSTAKWVEGLKDKVNDLIDCEIACIRDGNALYPHQQDIAINIANNIRERLVQVILTEEK